MYLNPHYPLLLRPPRRRPTHLPHRRLRRSASPLPSPPTPAPPPTSVPLAVPLPSSLPVTPALLPRRRRPPRGERPTSACAPLLANSSSSTSSSPPCRLRAPRKVPRLPPFSPQTFLALLCFPTTCSVKCCSHGKGEKTRLLFSGLLLLSATVVVLIRRGASRPVIVGAVL